ncbi:hypothetical protein JTB14_000121 [Gonioctena quinquepunctata]|nr:hypothetical protein JTB14_000121 [Gonioctena quinquepunctata]
MTHPKKTYIYINPEYGIEHNIVIPSEEPVSELVHLLIIKYNLPVYEENEFSRDLEDFVRDRSAEYYNEETTKLVNDAKDKINIEDVTKLWEKIMKEEMAEYGERRCASDDELFATVYHKMVHSPALETILQLEHMYSRTVRQKTEEKNRLIQELSERQSKEMNNAVDRLEKDMTETKINELVARHYETHALLQGKLTSELETIKEAQRREYREWLMQMLEENQTNSSLPTPNSPLTPPEIIIPSGSCDRGLIDAPILEESFTIHLGSQLKQMHNIRILSASVMDLCTVEDNRQLSEPTPQLLQTALALYSNDLSGLVLLADNKIGSRITKEFQDICQISTEFHFPHIEDQLNKISNLAQKYLKSDQRSSSRNSHSELLTPGDFYITRHSNLAQVHVIFHMVTDDSLRGIDINSRHPVVLGLRNILKTACSNDITSLTIPLLLQYEMTEDMTISWCEKRAELVFKCVKGFMIEMASWGGSDLKNLQFMLPPESTESLNKKMAEEVQAVLRNADAVCFDVDSTVIQEEGIDELAKFCNKGKEVSELTAKAMAGNMTFQEALKLRLDIIKPSQSQVKQFLETKPASLTPGIRKLVDLLHARKTPVFLVTGGFKCLIAPIAAQLNIPYEHIFANRLKFYFTGEYAGFDENAPTSRSGGKAVVIKNLKTSFNFENLVLVGDGATDLEACPPADAFIGYGGNVIRPTVQAKAKWFVTNFQEIIDVLNE